MSATPGFQVLNIGWRYATARIYDGTREPGQQVREGVNWIELQCLACGNVFHATESRGGVPGQFIATIGGYVHPICANPHCRQEATVELSNIQ